MTQKTNQFRSLIAASGQAPVAQSNAASMPADAPPTASRRPLGKRTAPDYVQVGVYIPKQLHNKAKVLLIHEEQDRDFSQLIGDLLSAYVDNQTSGKSRS